MSAIPLNELAARDDERTQLMAAFATVLDRGRYLGGPERDALEEELRPWTGGDAVVAVGSGSDAITLGLRAIGVGPGDEVIVPAFTAFACAAAVLTIGAVPVLVDVQADQPLLDPAAALSAVTERTRAALLVHLYGLVGDAAALDDALAPAGVAVVEDCSQAFGATAPDGRPVGCSSAFATFSFYPTKNLAAVGDGGAIATADAALADRLRALRNHGIHSEHSDRTVASGHSRIGELEAAAVRVRLRRFADHLQRRRIISERYAEVLGSTFQAHGSHGAPHLAVVRVHAPDKLVARLRSLDIGAGRHYPVALVDEPSLANSVRSAAPNARRWASECVSLPIGPHLRVDEVDRVAQAVLAHVQAHGEPAPLADHPPASADR